MLSEMNQQKQTLHEGGGCCFFTLDFYQMLIQYKHIDDVNKIVFEAKINDDVNFSKIHILCLTLYLLKIVM